MRLCYTCLVLCFTSFTKTRHSAGSTPPFELSGPFLASRNSYTWIDNSRNDSLAPPNVSQALRIVPFTIYSPSLPSAYAGLQVQYESFQDKHSPRSSLIHYLSPLLSQYYTENFLSYSDAMPDGLLSSLSISHTTEDAPIFPPGANFPVLFFSPAGATSRFLYGFLCTSLSSLGYVVIALDSVYDTNLVEIPGRHPTRRSIPFCEFNCTDRQRSGPNDFQLATHMRATDISYLLDEISQHNASSIRGGDSNELFQHIANAITANRTGVFGHSLGGSAATTLALRDERIRAAINMDGTLFDIEGIAAHDHSVLPGCNKPYLLMGVPGHDTSTDKTWLDAWRCFDATRRKQIRMKKSRHYVYSDVSILAEHSMPDGRQLAPTAKEALIGNVSGNQAFAATLRTVDLFFKSTLIDRKWNNASWDQLVRAWPVVELVS